MHLLNKYVTFKRYSELRQKSGKRHLSSLHNQCLQIQIECEQLTGAIELQRQFAESGHLVGEIIDRQRLFSWMRKNAIVLRKVQELCLELHKCQTRKIECEEKFESQRLLCKRLDLKQEKYTELVMFEKKKQCIKSINFEESEIEAKLSWTK